MLRRGHLNEHHTDLSDTASNARQRAIEAYPIAVAAGLEREAWAALVGVSAEGLDAWLADDAFVAACAAADTKALIAGTAEMPRLNKLAADLLSRIEEGVAGLDAFEAADLLKIVSRLREHRDRVRLAEADQYENLPLVVVNIGTGGVVTTTIEPAQKAEVVDVVAKEPVATMRLPAQNVH